MRVRLAAQATDKLRRHARPTTNRERGGLLLGWWDHGDIIIQLAVEVGDPGATFTTWTRHETAAQRALDNARATLSDPLIGYVGDWHTHPAPIGASPTDEAALRRASRQYDQPIALIVTLPDGSLDVHTARAGWCRPAHVVIEHTET
ncbi:Mov34/MPN/PAD-1 family protein [Nonomuraea purpurea]|uniref:Mov34/MPN/PAD-1 family protein n=1 Tax=Nonomuraea purpurea TaxID=1849276 RepID=A0ABV8GK49_9ACTN